MAAMRVTRFWLWAALAAAAQAASLSLIDAGPRIHFQHYFPMSTWSSNPWRLAAAFVLAIQAILVVSAGARRLSDALRSMAAHTGWPRIAFAAALCLSTGSALSPQPLAWLVELSLAGAIQLAALGNLVLAVLAIGDGAWARVSRGLTRWFGEPGGAPVPARGIDRFTATCAAAVTAVAAALSFFVYQNHPHIPDEVLYLLQASYFAAGKLTLPAPPVPEAFYVDLMTLDGPRWYGCVPPGWPAVLAIGVKLGVRWLVNPALAGVNLWLVSLLLRELLSPRNARIATLLLAVSPWFLFMSMNFMTHTLQMTAIVAASLGVARCRRTGRISSAVLAGLAVGFLMFVRPLDAIITGVLCGLWAIGLGGTRLTPASLAAFVLSAAAMSAATFPYNAHLTGDPFKTPVMDYFDRVYHPGSNDLGFGANRGVGWALDAFPGHTPVEAVINSLLNGFSVNIELHGWAMGSLWLAALVLFRRTRLDLSFTAVIAAVTGLYALYYFHGGPDFGARYWYQALLPLAALTVRGIDAVSETAGSQRPLAVALLASALALLTYVPWRAADKYWHYLYMRPDPIHLSEEARLGRSLVLVRGQSHPDYASASTYNPLDLRPESAEPVPVFAWDRDDATRARLLELYAGRPVWILEGPTVTGSGYVLKRR